MAQMTDREVVDRLNGTSRWNEARAAFSSACGRIEQAEAQRRKPSIFDIRRMEFEAVQKIAAALGVTIDTKGH